MAEHGIVHAAVKARPLPLHHPYPSKMAKKKKFPTTVLATDITSDVDNENDNANENANGNANDNGNFNDNANDNLNENDIGGWVDGVVRGARRPCLNFYGQLKGWSQGTLHLWSKWEAQRAAMFLLVPPLATPPQTSRTITTWIMA